MRNIENLGLKSAKEMFYNLSYEELSRHEMQNQGDECTQNGTFNVDTGIFTGRSPKDKYFVKQDSSQKYLVWGRVNRPISKELFDKLSAKAQKTPSGKNIYTQDAYYGAGLQSRKAVRFVTEVA